MAANSPESEASNSADDSIKGTELTLGLPGEPRRERSSGGGTKRDFSHSLDLYLGSVISDGSPDRIKEGVGGGTWLVEEEEGEEEEEASSAPKPPVSKAQLVGWPPVRASRKNATLTRVSKYVKVAADGAPYLRKVNLRTHNSYEQLLKALDDMFSSCFTIRNYFKDGKLMDRVNGSECVLTFEDKDGDWMMVGDVPWKMFVESCKRLRLMRSSEAIGLEPRTPTK